MSKIRGNFFKQGVNYKIFVDLMPKFPSFLSNQAEIGSYRLVIGLSECAHKLEGILGLNSDGVVCLEGKAGYLLGWELDALKIECKLQAAENNKPVEALLVRAQARESNKNFQ